MDEPQAPAFLLKASQRMQVALDRATPHIAPRWACLVVALVLYIGSVWMRGGFYIISYGLAIYNLNLLLGFITPQFDPDEGPSLPSSSKEEFKPFVRRLPEFKFWLSSIRSILIGSFLTLFRFFDVPVFWPILVIYWLLLFTVTMKRQIGHMIKHRYVPFTWGKKKYGGGGKESSKDST